MTFSRLDDKKSLQAGSRLFAVAWRASPLEDTRLADLGIVLGKSEFDANQFVLVRSVLAAGEV
jgi:hypothetical protein